MKTIIIPADLYHKASFQSSPEKIPLLISSFDLMIGLLLQGFSKKQTEPMLKTRLKTFKKGSFCIPRVN